MRICDSCSVLSSHAEIRLCVLHCINLVSKADNCTLALLASESEEVAQQTKLMIVKGFFEYMKYLLMGILNLQFYLFLFFLGGEGGLVI